MPLGYLSDVLTKRQNFTAISEPDGLKTRNHSNCSTSFDSLALPSYFTVYTPEGEARLLLQTAIPTLSSTRRRRALLSLFAGTVDAFPRPPSYPTLAFASPCLSLRKSIAHSHDTTVLYNSFVVVVEIMVISISIARLLSLARFSNINYLSSLYYSVSPLLLCRHIYPSDWRGGGAVRL